MAQKKKVTKKLLDELARRYYDSDYKDLCSIRKRVIDGIAQEELEKGAQN